MSSVFIVNSEVINPLFNTTCDTNSLIIDIGVNELGTYATDGIWTYILYYLDKQKAAGLVLWKDYINGIGGICIDGNKASDGSCTNRKKVCLKLVLLEGDTDQNVICSSIKTWIEGISSLSDDKKPHILISPIGYSETECTLNKVRDQQDFKILTIGGYSIDDDFYRTTPTIGYTPYIIIILFIYIY